MKHSQFTIDMMLFLPAVILTCIGLITLYSLNIALFRTQLFSLVLASFAFFFFSQMRIDVLQIFTKPIYILSLVLFFVVLVIGIESHGALRWISIFGTTFQFSEICKPFLAVSVSTFLSRHTDRSGRSFIQFFGLLLPLLVLIYLQPDLGNAIIYVGVAVLVSIIFGYPWKWYALIAVPILSGLPLFWSHLHQYQRQRIQTFIHPSKDVLGSSYNVIQAVIAVGSGKVFGKGLSGGTQSALRFLPERHTDFMFATVSEKFGFIGSIILLILFLTLFVRILMIYTKTADPFAKLFATMTLLLITIHMFLNIGMNIGIVPVVGITLPFVSYGGSSLLASFISLGILSSISTRTKKEEVLEIR